MYLVIILAILNLSLAHAQTHRVEARVKEKYIPYLDDFDELAFKKSLIGRYYNETCNLKLTIGRWQEKQSYGYTYDYLSPVRNIAGKLDLTISNSDLIITLRGTTYAEDFFDAPAPDKLFQKKFDELKKQGRLRRSTGITGFAGENQIVIQNRNAKDTLHYKQLSDCDLKTVVFKKTPIK